jgi:4-hydroxybenzoate polyprenyltransferase
MGAFRMEPLALIRALRPQQWSKNVFVFAAPLFASGVRGSGVAPAAHVGAAEWRHVGLAAAGFCLASSAVYLINDCADVEADRAHPEKRLRPIASGAVPVPLAAAVAALLMLVALALGLAAGGSAGGWQVFGVLGAYAVINTAYSLRLKHVVLVDAFCIATGFLLRVVAGGAAAAVEVSHWLLLCTLFLALFLALNKRRAEIALLGDRRALHRATLQEYSLPMLDQLVTILSATTIVCYAMYTVDAETVAKFESRRLMWTVPFVVFGIARYLFLVQSGRGGGNPTRIFLGGDALFLVNSLSWLAVVLAVVVWGW